MPTYEQVGTTNIKITTYKRIIAVDMVDAETIANEEPRIIYEGRTTSTGTCGVIGEVIDEMIEAMFTDFPHN